MRKGGAKASPFFFYGMPLSGETFISPIEFGVKIGVAYRENQLSL